MEYKEYSRLLADINNINQKVFNTVKQGIIDRHGRHHHLNENETFYETPYEDDDKFKITEIKVHEYFDQSPNCLKSPRKLNNERN